MKKRVIVFLVLCLFVLTNTALAADWVYYLTQPSVMPGYKEAIYIDAASATRDGDKLTYWVLAVLDKPYRQNAKHMLKMEVNLTSPRQYRIMAVYYYDSANREWDRDTTPSQWEKNIREDENREINFALQHAKEGRDSGQKPAP